MHPGFDIVIKPDQSALDNMNEFVTNMHVTSYFIEEIPNGVSLADAEYQVLEYILQHVPAEGSAPLAGNTIGTDRAFLSKYMPRVDGHLHYRSVDVSSIKELCRRWFPRVYFNAPEKHGGHRPSRTSSSRSASSSTTAAPASSPSPARARTTYAPCRPTSWRSGSHGWRSPRPSSDTGGPRPVPHVLLLSGRAGQPVRTWWI